MQPFQPGSSVSVPVQLLLVLWSRPVALYMPLSAVLLSYIPSAFSFETGLTKLALDGLELVFLLP